jgi:hypothetical protein
MKIGDDHDSRLGQSPTDSTVLRQRWGTSDYPLIGFPLTVRRAPRGFSGLSDLSDAADREHR